MAHLNVKPDPAYLKLAAMQKSRHLYFRWTPQTARFTFLMVVAIPTAVGYLAYQTQGLWDLRAKRRGDMAREK
ncbi:hypothetical protein LIA77_09501 [Sarocladium implicatum]|nr:hypothetical protein LIA77_09501 [Sarocladium implicatum]